ncbi:hypothetical protein Scep_015073 [Stephania cephalantha]|uniref:poly(A)-specific ribonuclease n=1 Tax=Stephania cephalantha TaxID=152367 RepID=A0AAP0J4N0_9MAGN
MSSSNDENRQIQEIREVWAHNLESEFALINELIDSSSYSMISMDTEFPGVIYHHPNPSHRHDPRSHYSLLKSNVDALHLIQLGLTLADPDPTSPLPTITFQFNFRDFDLRRPDPHSPDSILLLSHHAGIDFDATRRLGAHSSHFAQLLISSGIVLNPDLTWVTFHSAYDFGYLIKILTGADLPKDLEGFLGLVRVFFGERVYDVKHLMRFCGGKLYGGLERVARVLELERVAGKCHQAGSDSLLTWHAFERIKERWFCDGEDVKHAGVLYGLEVV